MSDDRPDPGIRELTYQLMGMAPDAPQFPEEATVMTVPTSKQRSPALIWLAAAAVVVLLVGLPLFLFRGGGAVDEPAGTTVVAPTSTVVAPSTTVPTSTTAPSPPDVVRREFAIYLFSDDLMTPLGDPALVPVHRFEDYVGTDSLDVGARVGDAIDHLLATTDLAGYTSSIPVGLGGFTVITDDDRPGVVTVDLPAGFEVGGGTMLMTTRLAQVVFTATQFPEVDSVLFAIEGEIVEVFSGEGLVLEGPQTREDYVDILPFIFLDTPWFRWVAPSPIRISGVANVFEATVLYEIVADTGEVLADGFTTASCGTGCWGDFSVDVPYDAEREMLGEVVVYEESARDGSRINELRYPVTLVPGNDGPVPTTTVPPTTTEPPVTTTTLPGEAFDIGPQAGEVVAVVGVEFTDVLNLRAGPGTGYEIVTGLDPLSDGIVATGRHRLLTGSIWNEVTANGVTGWVNSRYLGYLGGVDDLTSFVVDQLGGIPEAETMLDLGTMIAESFDPGEGGFRYEMVIRPTVGDLGEVTFDVVGLLDDAQLGWRLHIFGQPTASGEGFSLMSVEATAFCGRGVTEDGLCV